MNANDAEGIGAVGDLTEPVSEPVRRAWELIAGRLPAHRPWRAKTTGAADEARVAAVERRVRDELGMRLPPDLLGLWRLDGVHAGYWLPPEGSCTLEVPEETLALREFMLGIAAAESPEDPQWADRFTEDLLPIATSPGGDSLVVRLRPDETYGQVHFWDHELWGLGVPLWPSVAAMLDDTASALLSGGPALTWHVANGGEEPLVVPLLNARNQLEDWVRGPGPVPRPLPGG